MGRPSSFTEDIADRVCDGIIEGKSLISICLPEDMPEVRTVLRWVAKGDLGDERYVEFRQQYAHAMDLRSDFHGEQIIEIADDAARDVIGGGENEHGFVNQEVIQRAKLRIDTRKWLMGKQRPKKYGEKTTTEHTGANGGPIATIDLTLTPQEAKNLSQALDDEC